MNNELIDFIVCKVLVWSNGQNIYCAILLKNIPHVSPITIFNIYKMQVLNVSHSLFFISCLVQPQKQILLYCRCFHFTKLFQQ